MYVSLKRVYRHDAERSQELYDAIFRDQTNSELTIGYMVCDVYKGYPDDGGMKGDKILCKDMPFRIVDEVIFANGSCFHCPSIRVATDLIQDEVTAKMKEDFQIYTDIDEDNDPVYADVDVYDEKQDDKEFKLYDIHFFSGFETKVSEIRDGEIYSNMENHLDLIWTAINGMKNSYRMM